ncbi:MAG: META domain-containing protein, partial [Bacteroidota bacterium]
MFNQFNSIVFLILSIFLIISCAKNNKDCQNRNAEDLLGVWEYESGEVGEKEDIRNTPFLRFSEDGEFSGSNSDNSIAGDYQVTMEGVINIDIKISTYAAETPWASAFSQTLIEVDQFCINDDILHLTSRESGHELFFRKKENLAECLSVQQNNTLFQDLETVPFEWKAFRLDGTCLEVEVTYGGGCGDVSMQLIVGEDYAESLPPIVAAKLVFSDNDPCRALVTESF